MPNYYPVFLNIENRICLVVGGGPVAARKAAGLLEAGATVRIVAPEFCADVDALSQQGGLERIEAPYNSGHLDSVVLAFAATNITSVNAQVVHDASERGILVNSADAPGIGGFIVPSVLRRGGLCISVSTGGASPKLAARIRRQLETLYGDEFTAYVELLGDMRSYIKSLSADSTERSDALEVLMDSEDELRAILRDAGKQAAHDEARRLIIALRAKTME